MVTHPVARPYWSLTSLTGRGVIIAGAADRVGFAVAERALEAGASVLVVDTDADAVDRLQRALSSVGVTYSLVADASRSTEVGRILAYAMATLPNLYGLVYNIGVRAWTRVPTMTDEMWKGFLETRLVTASSYIRAFSRASSCHDGTSIVLVGAPDSPEAIGARGALVEHTAAEMGRLVNLIAMEMAERHVRVNAVVPTIAARPADDTARLTAFYLSDLSQSLCGVTLPVATLR